MNTQHNGRKHPKQDAGSREMANTLPERLHSPTPEAPSSRSDAVDPRRRQERLKTTKHGLHAQSERKNSLAREDHAPISGGPRSRNS